MSVSMFGVGLAIALGLAGVAGLVVLPRKGGGVLVSNRNTVAASMFLVAIAVLFVTTLGPLLHTFKGGFPAFADRVLLKYPQALLDLLSHKSG